MIYSLVKGFKCSHCCSEYFWNGMGSVLVAIFILINIVEITLSQFELYLFLSFIL